MLPILTVTQLAKVHPNGERPYLFANIQTEISKPEIIAVLGASGQGKTTFLRALAKLELCEEGLISFHDKHQSHCSSTEWRKHVCYVPQQPVMFGGSVKDNLRTVSILHQRPFEEELACSFMKQAGLEDMDWNKSAAELSGGEKQRIALIRALLLRSEIVLLDEVSSSLDSRSKQQVEQMLISWHEQQQVTLIWVTHDLEQARRVSSRVWFMADGTLLEDCSSLAFFEKPESEPGKAFLHWSAMKEVGN